MFEGARLITGEGGAPIENSAFLVEGNTFTRVGRRGDVPLPEGASRVDLTGKTVMPAIINAHGHVGYRRGKSFTAENYTRENIIDHLQRFAYHGVAAVMSMGAERPEGLRAARRAQGGTAAGHGPLPLRRPGHRDAGRRTGAAAARRTVRRVH